MIVVNTHEAKSRLSELLRLVEERRERIRVCRNGRPVAEIGPIPAEVRDPLERSTRLRGIVFREDPAAPLAEEDWPTEGR
jgi:prevent-host-death family protein